jgi:hypothetical protein
MRHGGRDAVGSIGVIRITKWIDGVRETDSVCGEQWHDERSEEPLRGVQGSPLASRFVSYANRRWRMTRTRLADGKERAEHNNDLARLDAYQC